MTTDFDSRVQAIEESMDWRHELKKSHADIASIIFPRQKEASDALWLVLNALKVSQMQGVYQDEVDGWLDTIEAAISSQLTYRWEDELSREFEHWRQDKAIEIAKEDA